jgi:hypothetical protein
MPVVAPDAAACDFARMEGGILYVQCLFITHVEDCLFLLIVVLIECKSPDRSSYSKEAASSNPGPIVLLLLFRLSVGASLTSTPGPIECEPRCRGQT